jgi:hypothetical protein
MEGGFLGIRIKFRPDTAPGTSSGQVVATGRSLKVCRRSKQNGPGEITGAVVMASLQRESGGATTLTSHALLQVATIDQVRLSLAIDHGVIHHNLADVLQRG